MVILRIAGLAGRLFQSAQISFTEAPEQALAGQEANVEQGGAGATAVTDTGEEFSQTGRRKRKDSGQDLSCAVVYRLVCFQGNNLQLMPMLHCTTSISIFTPCSRLNG